MKESRAVIAGHDINVVLATVSAIDADNGDKQLTILLFSLIVGCKQCRVAKETLIELIHLNWPVEIPIGGPIIPDRKN